MAEGLKLLDAYVEVHADASKVGDEAAKQVESGSGGLLGAGRRVGLKFAGALAGAFAAQKVGDFLVDSVGKASDLNETISASQQIFGASAREIEAWGGTAATAMGMSKKEAIDSATQFGNMFQQLGIGNARATDMSKSLVQMAADFGSFNNLPTADVLDSIQGAMRGEYDSLQRIIPNISAARVQQEALNETHKKSASSLTAAEKAQATMNILQKDGAKMSGDFARTSGGLANQQKIAAAQTENLKTQIGTNLLPVVKSVTQFLNSSVLPALSGMASWLSKNQWILPPLGIALGGLAVAIGVVTVAMWLLSLTPVALTIGGIVLAVAALIGIVVLLITHWDMVIAVWNRVVAAFAYGGQQIVGFIIGLWNGIVSRFVLGGQQIISFVVGFWNGTVSRFALGGQQIVGFVVNAWNLIVAAIRLQVAWIRAAINGVVGFITGVWSAGWHLLTSVVASTVGSIVSRVRGFIGTIRGIFAGIGAFARDAGSALIHGFVSGIQNAVGFAVSTVKGFMDKIAGFFPHSPAKEGPFSGRGWTPYSGRATAVGFAQGLEAGIPDVASAASRMMGAAAAGPTSLSPTSGRWATNGSPAAVATSKGDTHVYYVTIDGRTVDTMTKVAGVFGNLKQGARQGAGTTMAVGA